MLQSFRWITRLAPEKLSLSLGMGILLSTGIGLACYGLTLNSIEEDAYTRFTSIAHGMHYTISGRLKSYTDLLRGTASLFQTNDVVDRDEFHRYVKGLSMESEFPGVEAVNFARFVTDAERPAFEERMRKELAAKDMGYPMDFKISPPGHRPSYTSASASTCRRAHRWRARWLRRATAACRRDPARRCRLNRRIPALACACRFTAWICH
jgi:hypothetical protein